MNAMDEGTIAVSGSLIVLLALFAGVIWLQTVLSKKESKWPGLILPGISLGFSLLLVLGLLLFRFSTGTSLWADGELVGQMEQTAAGETASFIATAAVTFLLCNIPTGILLAVYAAFRGGRKKKRALEKMRVQDLD
ncbi:MAG: hypothetical protein FWG72_00715 [Oscillospiraceae bacterium]|nr:hypothetical protein [Oscillospiraceae bacterium]